MIFELFILEFRFCEYFYIFEWRKSSQACRNSLDGQHTHRILLILWSLICSLFWMIASLVMPIVVSFGVSQYTKGSRKRNAFSICSIPTVVDIELMPRGWWHSVCCCWCTFNNIQPLNSVGHRCSESTVFYTFQQLQSAEPKEWISNQEMTWLIITSGHIYIMRSKIGPP